MIKPIRTFLLLLLAASFTFSLGIPAFAENSGNYEYTLNEDGEATITGYKGNAYILDLPDVIDEHPVVGIGDLAFAGNEDLHRVTIPLSVREIGVNPFAGCSDLRRIFTSPRNEIFSTDSGALFRKADKAMISIAQQWWLRYTIPEGIEIIDKKTFAGAAELKRVTIPSTVREIRAGAFEGCEAFTEIAIPDSVVSIGNSAFKDCKGLKDVYLPACLKVIRESTFENCSSIEQFTFPTELVSLGDSAFKNCTKLKSLQLPSKLSGIGDMAFFGCSALNSISFNAELSTIGNGAFSGCISLSGIKLPAHLTSIGAKAFNECTGLTDINLQDTSITEIGDSAFQGCEALETVVIPHSIETVPMSLFADCTALDTVNIRDGVKTIRTGAFSGCEELHNLMLPDGLERIDDLAFMNCYYLYNLVLPDSISSIQPNSFSGCPDLRFTLNRDTYNEQYAIDNSIYYRFPDSSDWLKEPAAVEVIPDDGSEDAEDNNALVCQSITLGKYEQDADESNGPEEIEWVILDVDETTGAALAISKYALNCGAYSSTDGDATWEKSSLREWMNGEFFSAAFNDEEQEKILTSLILQEKNPETGTDPGSDTEDRVFLLSISEAEKYFQNNIERQCKPTAYCTANGASKSDSCAAWWLRTPGRTGTNAAYVFFSGAVLNIGCDVNSGFISIRPAMWIKN